MSLFDCQDRDKLYEYVLNITDKEVMGKFLGLVAIVNGPHGWEDFQKRHNEGLLQVAEWLKKEEGHKCVTITFENGFVYINWCRKFEDSCK